jgi:hypothetical protein
LDDDSFESRDGSTGEVVQSVIEHVKGAIERDLSRRKKLRRGQFNHKFSLRYNLPEGGGGEGQCKPQ